MKRAIYVDAIAFQDTREEDVAGMKGAIYVDALDALFKSNFTFRSRSCMIPPAWRGGACPRTVSARLQARAKRMLWA